MVSKLLYEQDDVVAERLSQAGEASTRSVIQWLQAQQERSIMRRRAAACAISGWGLLATAALVSCFVAVKLSLEAQAIFSETFSSAAGPPPMFVAVPVVLGIVAAIIVIGGVAAWWGGWFPGWSRTLSALDWSSSSDAVNRLLAIGCTYPEAFRLAADVSRGPASQAWLKLAADRVEQGGPPVAAARFGRGDVAMLEAMVEAAGSEPARQWRIASDHFFQLAARRLMLLMQAMPMIATILSGLLVWIAISTTLGWMWRSAAEMIRGLS